MAKNTQRTLSDFDRLVESQLKKSVVVAPKDPNGGAKLPRRQSDAAARKVNGKVQYPAIFDREAQRSNDQLEDWEEATQLTTQSPEDFVNDDDDAPEDYDAQQWEDNRSDDDGAPGVYDPFTDDDDLDDEDLESLDLPDDDDEYITVKKHKRRKMRKSNSDARGDMDEDYVDLSDDDDEDGEFDEDDESEKKRKMKKSRRVRKSRSDDEPEYDDADDEDDDEEDLEKVEKSIRRRRQVRKALGADAMKYVDGNEFIKSLTDAVFDMQDHLIAEVRSLRLENQKLRKLVQRENRQMAKALVSSQMQIAGVTPLDANLATPQQTSQAVRKSVTAYGQVPRTTQVAPRNMDLTKAFDVLEEAYVNGGDPVLSRDMTMLENDGLNAIGFLSNTAREVLAKANLI